MMSCSCSFLGRPANFDPVSSSIKVRGSCVAWLCCMPADLVACWPGRHCGGGAAGCMGRIRACATGRPLRAGQRTFSSREAGLIVRRKRFLLIVPRFAKGTLSMAPTLGHLRACVHNEIRTLGTNSTKEDVHCYVDRNNVTTL